jgi:hypothetical protein
MEQTVCRRPPAAKLRFRVMASSRGVYGGQIGTRTGFPAMLHTHLIIYD